MRVLFVQNFWQPYLGVSSLAAVCRKAGHECSVIIAEAPSQLLNAVSLERPDVLGFSCMTAAYRWSLRAARAVKQVHPRLTIVFGGVHPTICPEIIQEDGIDIVCRGEGENAIVGLLDALSGGQDHSGIPSLWVKTPRGVVRNDVGPLVNDLDSLPFPDRSIYFDRYPILRNLDSKAVMIGRGCPYPCSYCVNHAAIEMCRGKGRFVRRRSPENVMAEIDELASRYPMKHIYFNDDTFTLDIEWLERFLPAFSARFALPFTCGTRADLVTTRLVELLRRTGCYCVEMGIETGDEAYRINVLQKKISNRTFLDAAGLMRDAGLRLKTSNMMAMPGETVEMAFSTIALNRQCGVELTNCALFQPYPALVLTEYAQSRGYLPRDFDFTSLEGMSYRDTPIQGDDVRKLKNLQKFFLLAVRYSWLEPLIRRLINLPANFVFDAVFKISYLLNYASYHKIPVWKAVRLALKSRKHY